MDRRTIELRVGGQSYRVVSSAPEEDVRRAASMLSAKVEEIGASKNGLFLAAIALANEAISERERRVSIERRTRDLLRRLLARVEHALEPLEGDAQDESSRG
jgi:cell division protein ZapA